MLYRFTDKNINWLEFYGIWNSIFVLIRLRANDLFRYPHPTINCQLHKKIRYRHSF